ncbi:MAG: M15 family metallopeptidase [Clostridia bacterium]|jgi:D-alanyl-D-alanine carboxypeptidase|nr:M15 family metallopeptidase [Clostridia bacterium]MBO7297070.1 M15 family metallopeptidase [Clostridia bacterium]
MNIFKAILLPLCLICGMTMTAGCNQIENSEYIYTENSEYLVLLNKTHPSGESYCPPDLTALDSTLTLYGKEVELRLYAAKAAETMIRELHAQGYTDIVVTSGYRSYAYQSTLFYTYLSQEAAAHPNWSEAQVKEYVLTYSAAPGTSEHHTGNAIDLISTNYVVLDETFAQNPAYEWLQQNAHRYGFILRYPADKTEITGYSYEPWHYRFVGAAAATEIHEHGLTLEEYLGILD